MSVDLKRDLRTYVSYLDSLSAHEYGFDPMAVAGLRHVSVDAIPRQAVVRRGLWVAAATAILTLVTLGLTSLLVGNGSQPADTVVPTTASEPVPTTIAESAPTTLGEQLPPSWSIVPATEAGLGEGVIRGVALGGPGLVAVGSDAYPYGGPALWTSVDGVSWTPAPLDEEMLGWEDPSSVIAAGPGLVVVGGGVWTSEDGSVWNPATLEGGIGDATEISSVTVGGPGLVAVGEDAEGVTAWTSVDGIVWSRITQNEAIFGESPNLDLTMSDVTVGGPGLVAVGMDFSGVDADAAVWTSVDGLTWTRVPHDEEVFGGSGHQAMSGVIAAGPGLVAVGTERSARQQAVVWTSVDGLIWERVAPDGSGSLDSGQMNSVIATDSGLVAVGWVGSIGGPNSIAAVWTSTDGIVWTRVSHEEEAIGNGLMWEVVGTDRGLLAAGSDGTSAAVWLGPEYSKGEQ